MRFRLRVSNGLLGLACVLALAVTLPVAAWWEARAQGIGGGVYGEPGRGACAAGYTRVAPHLCLDSDGVPTILVTNSTNGSTADTTIDHATLNGKKAAIIQGRCTTSNDGTGGLGDETIGIVRAVTPGDQSGVVQSWICAAQANLANEVAEDVGYAIVVLDANGDFEYEVFAGGTVSSRNVALSLVGYWD